jgi:DnaJ-related protein SCJ1
VLSEQEVRVVLLWADLRADLRQTRKIYDRHGEEGLKQHEARKQGGGHQDPFSRFFGGGGGGQQEQRGPGMLTNLEVSLADMYTGRTVEVSNPFVLAIFPP